ncbi:GntR family transcriptional regulator [Hoeflea poritis]|uniref:GntR family transcriptional regulator n=1 Tax=Hoeflea poritis TaxID=2993659 RepID=A0ABT4VPJ9_9HYPH|nr:GntR family transcriptional regulator [Hoeflea poritis]MDA4846616.1 GntR family transcriptional regulator [Hoeflea poritis]
MSNPAQRTAATDQAYHAIRSDILSGTLKEGERITEQRMAENLGLSRTPVREAISKLIHEGFVERGTGYTTRVAHFEDEELEQMFQIRKLLESYGAARAAEFATDEQVEHLKELSAEMSAHTPPKSQSDYKIISAANEKFHRTIMEAARSPRLSALISMAVNVGMVARMYHLYSDEDLIRSAAHHHEITDAIAARSPEWAASVMSSHLLAAASMAARAGQRKVPAAF